MGILGKTSSGNGKSMVEFFSAAILDNVWYNLSFIAEGDLSICNPASSNLPAACSSASARIILDLLDLIGSLVVEVVDISHH